MFFLGSQISFPSDLEQSIRKALWANENPQAEVSSLGKSLRSLWPKLAKDRGINETSSHYSFQAAEARAYAAYYLTANALKPSVILEEAHLLGLDLFHEENKWLDIGTGPGTFYWGLAWWAKHRNKKCNFIGMDQSPLFAKIASQLANQAKMGVPARFEIAEKNRDGSSFDWITAIKKANPTHISFMNSVTEIFPSLEKRIEAIEKILGTMKEQAKRDGKNRYLLLVEPGSRENSRDLQTLKDHVTSNQFATVLLPCTSNRACGALKSGSDWCHEEVACEMPEWLNEIGMEAKLKKESLLFSYVLFSTQNEANLPSNLMRMVSQRMERKGQVECFFCTENGKERLRVQNSKVTNENNFFLRVNRGELFSKIDFTEKGDVIEATPFSQSKNDSLFNTPANS